MKTVYVMLDPRCPGDYRYGDFCFNFEPFYVGCGTEGRSKRVWRYKHDSNPLYLERSSGIRGEAKRPISVVIREGLSQSEGYWLEKRLVELIGRVEFGEGPLTNRSIGGGPGSPGCIGMRTKGRTGQPHSEETKRKMSDAQKGRVFSDEHRRKLSEGARRRWGKCE